MPTLALSLPVSGTVIAAGLHSTNYNAIQLAVNALDNNNIAAGAGIDGTKLFAVIRGVQIITSTGTYTPTSGTHRVYVECVGGGGGGAGCVAGAAGTGAAGGGGGSGAYSAAFLMSGFSGVTATIGAAGNGGAAGANNGATGGDTSFGSVVVAKAGVGGLSMGATAPNWVLGGGPGGAASTGTGDLKIDGSAGSPAFVMGGGAAVGGNGGASVIGGAGKGADGNQASNVGGVGGNYGAGGGGAASGNHVGTAKAGGNGAAGVIRVWEFA